MSEILINQYLPPIISLITGLVLLLYPDQVARHMAKSALKMSNYWIPDRNIPKVKILLIVVGVTSIAFSIFIIFDK